jgi:CubicO group peptidase (beta-lactamase class C family)
MKHIYRILVISILVVGFSPFDNRIASANFNESEILTDLESHELSSLIASSTIYKIDSLVNKFHTQQRFSGNILVALAGQEIFSRSVGYQDPLKKETLAKNNIFQLASVSKQFTATAIMLLSLDGKVEFEEMVTKYIPEFPYKGISLNHLLHHTSGLPNYMYLVDKYWKSPNSPNNDDVIKLLAKYKLPVFFQPGSRYDYSNTGYVILATVVQRVSGVSLNSFLQDRIFKPLGMNNTYVFSSADSTCRRMHIDGFKALKRGYIRYQTSHNDGPVGDKGICSTIEDMFKWDRALYQESIITKEMLDLAFMPAKDKLGRDIPYGYGFRLKQSADGERVIYHNGIWQGFRTNFHRYIESGNTIIVLNNTSIRSNHELVSKIENILANSKEVLETAKITQIVLNEGVESAKEYYLGLTDADPFFNLNVRKLMDAADFMSSIGKEKKAEEIRELCNSLMNV